MSDLENRIADTLRSGADQVYAAPDLAEGALRRAGVIRRRRRARTTAVSALAVVAAGALALPQILPGRTTDGAAPASPGPTVTSAATAIPYLLPLAPEVPAAQAQPSAVGTDPRILHFNVDHRVPGEELAAWTSAPGVESFVSWGELARSTRTEVYLSPRRDLLDDARLSSPVISPGPSSGAGVDVEERDPESVTAGGQAMTVARLLAGTATGWVVRWQPVPGLHAMAQVWAGDREQALRIPAAVRVDRSQHCVTPMRLTRVPSRARLEGCSVALRTGSGRWDHAELTWSGGFVVWSEDKVPLKVIPNTTVGGRDAVWKKQPPSMWILDFDDNMVSVDGVPRETVAEVAAGLSFATDLTKPSSWPRPA